MKYLIFNETDGVYAYPEPVSGAEAKRIIVKLRERYQRQGYYASAAGHIPVSELSLILIRDEYLDPRTDTNAFAVPPRSR